MYSVRLTEYLMNFIRCTISKSVFVFVRDSRNNSTRVEFMAVTDLFAPPPRPTQGGAECRLTRSVNIVFFRFKKSGLLKTAESQLTPSPPP